MKNFFHCLCQYILDVFWDFSYTLKSNNFEEFWFGLFFSNHSLIEVKILIQNIFYLQLIFSLRISELAYQIWKEMKIKLIINRLLTSMWLKMENQLLAVFLKINWLKVWETSHYFHLYNRTVFLLSTSIPKSLHNPKKTNKRRCNKKKSIIWKPYLDNVVLLIRQKNCTGSS